VALIELSPEAPAPPAAATPPPAYFYRRVGLALAALLVFALGGAAPVSSAPWKRIGRVPVAAESSFQLLGGRLYTVEPNAAPWAVSAWQPGTLRRLWRYTGTGPEVPFLVTGGTSDVTLLRAGGSTSVLDARTGAVRWRSPGQVQQLAGEVGLVQEERFRPGTEYDPDTGAPGRLYGTTSDVLHTEPAQSTELRGVELATGRRLWSVSVPGSVYTASAGAPAPVLVVLSADRLTVRSAETGAVLREREIPRLGGLSAAEGEIAGDTVLVHYGAFGEGGWVTAYALDTLDQRWQQKQPDPAGSSVNCVGLPCAKVGDNVTVLDPRTGAVRWHASDVDVMAFGAGSALETQGETSPLRTVDLGTGRPEAQLDSWQNYFPVYGRDAYVLSRPEPDGSLAFGLLLPDRHAVQPLGRLPGGSAECQAESGTLACRAGDGIEVWSYSA
jgi:hypothetical protein